MNASKQGHYHDYSRMWLRKHDGSRLAWQSFLFQALMGPEL